MTDVLSRRGLNRATPARQYLLERAPGTGDRRDRAPRPDDVNVFVLYLSGEWIALLLQGAQSGGQIEAHRVGEPGLDRADVGEPPGAVQDAEQQRTHPVPVGGCRSPAADHHIREPGALTLRHAGERWPGR
nr:hypothetical protein [Nonomuraea basaltis]